MKVCTLASGSSGNSTYIEENGTGVLIDAGLSGKAILNYLEKIEADYTNIEGILVTHEHIDHIKGVGVLSRKFDLKVYATEKTWDEMSSFIGDIPEDNKEIIESGNVLEIGGLKIDTFETSHDAADSVGYCFYAKDTKVGIATDTGYLTQSARKCLDGADFMVFEANHDLQMLRNGKYPWSLKKRILSDRGHLSNVAAGHCLASLVSGKTMGVVLAHLSQENNLPDLAFTTVAETLNKAGIYSGDGFELDVAPRLNPSKVWDIK